MRTDAHAPKSLITEDYEYVGCFDNQPPTGSFVGDGVTIEIDGHQCEGTNYANACYRYFRGLVTSSKSAVYGDGFQCDHCGARIRYAAVLLHKPTGDHIAVGETCLDNRFDRSTADFQAMRFAAQLDREQKAKLTAALQFFADHPEVDWDTLCASNNWFVKDVLGKLRKYGSISAKQIAAIEKAVARDAETAARAAVEALLPKADAPVGKGLTVTGVVLAKKWVESNYGGTEKMLVQLGDDVDGLAKVWGSVPASLDGDYNAETGVETPSVQPGDTVTFTANFEASADPDFSYFKRPRKAAIVLVAAPAE